MGGPAQRCQAGHLSGQSRRYLFWNDCRAGSHHCSVARGALFHRVVDEDLATIAGVKQLLAGGDALVSHVRRTIEALDDGYLINGLRSDRGNHIRVRSRYAVTGRRPVREHSDRATDVKYAHLCAGRWLGACPRGSCRVNFISQDWAGAGLSPALGSNGGAVCCGPAWGAGQPDVPDRRPGALA